MHENLYWLRNHHLEAAFSVENGMRLAIIRTPGSENILRACDGPCRGLKTWVMMPSDIAALRDMLSEEASEVGALDPSEIRMQTFEPNRWGLVLEWVARLEDTGPEIQLTQRIHNHGQETHYLGIWSIAAFSQDTRIRIPFGRPASLSLDHPNRIAVFPYTNIGDGRILSTPEFIEVNLLRGSQSESIKLGMVQSKGRVLALRENQVLEMSAPYEVGTQYPEGGSNVTVFSCPADQADIFGEAEVMGPLQLLEPGASMEFQIRVRLGN
jgi:hypothetical protein